MKQSSRFSYMNHARKALAIGIASRKNVLLTGRGGHAKTELVDAVFEEYRGEGASTFTQSVHSDQAVADLYGGIDSEFAKEYIFDRYRLSGSFLNYDLVRFEELLDGPPRVLCSLKDTLTSGRYRHGDFSYPMRTRSVIGCTNHDPEKMKKIDPSVEALLERFPLVVNVEWDAYAPASYLAMFDGLQNGDRDAWEMPSWEVVSRGSAATLDRDTTSILCEFLGIAVSLGAYVSPRTAVYCRDVIGAWAALEGSDQVTIEHFEALQYIGPISGVYAIVLSKFDETRRITVQKAALGRLRKNVVAIAKAGQASGSIDRAALAAILQEIEATKWHDLVNASVTRLSADITRLLEVT